MPRTETDIGGASGFGHDDTKGVRMSTEAILIRRTSFSRHHLGAAEAES